MKNNFSILLPSAPGREEKLSRLLERIGKEVYETKTKVILVLDKSRMLEGKEFYGIDTIFTHKIGYWRCLNVALDHIGYSEPFIYTADDILPDDGWLEKAIEEWEKRFPDGLGLMALNDDFVLDAACGHGVTTKLFLNVLFGEPKFPEQFEHLFLDTLISDRAKDTGAYYFLQEAHMHHQHYKIGNVEQDEVSKRNEARAKGDKLRKDAMDERWAAGEKHDALVRLQYYKREGEAMDAEKLNTQNRYATIEEILYLRDKMSLMLPKDAVIVMIGSGPGVLLMSLLDSEASDKWEITVIDINSTQYARDHLRLGKQSVAAYVPRIRWIAGEDSYDVGMNWNETIDLLIIDGDHSERGVRRDMDAWLEHVGKYVLFHDYDYTGTVWEHKSPDEYPAVKPFVDEVMGEYGWLKIWQGGTAVVYERK